MGTKKKYLHKPLAEGTVKQYIQNFRRADNIILKMNIREYFMT